MIPVILSGGAGTRLWPVSTAATPKQLLALTGDLTMLQMTARRGAGLVPPIVVGNARHADMIEAQLDAAGVPAGLLICEPTARNTAPAIALAALSVADPAATLLVMPSDHVIANLAAFRAAIDRALPLVRDGALCTFGIRPDGPATGYGYIRLGAEQAPGVHRVERFCEKPERSAAEAMVADGRHVWNAGIFLFRADRYLNELARHAPAMVNAARDALARGRREGNRLFPDRATFAQSPSDSIDYAVMERSDRVVAVPVDMGWSDVGSWDAVHAISPQDAERNVLPVDTVAIDASGCLVRSDGPRVSLIGVHDLIVLIHDGEVVILHRDQAQRIKDLATLRATDCDATSA